MYKSFVQVVLEETAPHFVESIFFPEPLDWRLPYFFKQEGYQIFSVHKNHSSFLFMRGFVENNREKLTRDARQVFLSAKVPEKVPAIFQAPFLTTSQSGLLARWAERIEKGEKDIRKCLLWWVFYRVMFYWYFQRRRPLLALEQLVEHYIREANRLVFSNDRANLALLSSTPTVLPLFSGEMASFMLEEKPHIHPVHEAFQAILHHCTANSPVPNPSRGFIWGQLPLLREIPVWCFHITGSGSFLRTVETHLTEYKRRKKVLPLRTSGNGKGSYAVVGW